jgi:hypothetical protein
MSIIVKETVEKTYLYIRDSRGILHRLDKLMTGEEARMNQVYPGFSVIYISPPESDTECHRAVTVPDSHLKEILEGNMILHITTTDDQRASAS